ncbi:hypothetical protein BJV77DRAFT_1071480 [Russula vinacea]|nr:hypothetical protein BJV77DRAFT_1071480 [Russula vinacea]
MTRSSGPAHKDDPPPFEPLPDNNVFSRQTHPSWHDAYARCTRLFFWAVGRQPPPGAASYDMCSRVLGHLVLEAPTERGRDWVCKRILSCPDEQALARLAQKFIFTFIGACADSTCAKGLPVQSALLDVTLVIPPSVDIRTLSRYAGLSNDDPLCAPTPRFYRLENMLTLDDDVSDAFRSLNVWLEEEKVRASINPSPDLPPLPAHGEYQIVTWQSGGASAAAEDSDSDESPPPPRYTTAFRSTDLRTRPVPSVHYLRLHAACARVAHKSGAAAYIEELARDIARLTVLAEDGSSAGVLAAALARAAAT